MRLFRGKRTGPRLIRIGFARSAMFASRDLLENEVGSTSLGQVKKDHCVPVSRAYMASANNELKKIVRSLCRERLALENSRKHKLPLIDNLADQLADVYRWHADWYDEDAMRAPSLERLPQKAASLKEVVRAC